MANLSVDFSKATGKIKPVHGVGQPPFSGMDFSMIRYLKEANIPFSRLHDVGGPYGRNQFVDIPNVFRDFDADPADPEAYDFAFTDLLMAALVENGVEPFFRLGVTIENYALVKPYRIFPPKDYLKWAKICEGIIRHYTQGWANGFHYDIRYWEIWNEPDNYEDIAENQMWHGTKEQYYELYDVAATYLKGKFPHLKIGGYASCGFYAICENKPVFAAKSTPRVEYFIRFLDGFLDYIKEHRSPLDFFSWHSYDSIAANKLYAAYARKRLDEAGYESTETTCNEWNCTSDAYGTLLHAAQNTAMLVMFQHAPLDSAMFYDARLGLGPYGGMFDPVKRVPTPLYYGFKAFGELYRMGSEAFSQSDDGNVYLLAAERDGAGGILIVNVGEETELNLRLAGQSVKTCRVVGEENPYEEIALPKTIGENEIIFLETTAGSGQWGSGQ